MANRGVGERGEGGLPGDLATIVQKDVGICTGAPPGVQVDKQHDGIAPLHHAAPPVVPAPWQAAITLGRPQSRDAWAPPFVTLQRYTRRYAEGKGRPLLPGSSRLARRQQEGSPLSIGQAIISRAGHHREGRPSSPGQTIIRRAGHQNRPQLLLPTAG